jgi:hypothetical protein
MTTLTAANPEVVFWLRELPPLAATPIGEHVVEASSERVLSTLAHRDELWTICHADLLEQAERRVCQEIVRLGGRYAHVISESIEPHRDAATDQAWLQGRFIYMLYS